MKKKREVAYLVTLPIKHKNVTLHGEGANLKYIILCILCDFSSHT